MENKQNQGSALKKWNGHKGKHPDLEMPTSFYTP
jgi:hypothetical protein